MKTDLNQETEALLVSNTHFLLEIREVKKVKPFFKPAQKKMYVR